MQSESRTVERKAGLDYTFREGVVGYLDQALELEISFVNRSGRNSRISYNPDFIVFYQDSIWIEEWKDAGDVQKLLKRSPGRYVLDEDGGLRSPPAELSAEKLGLKYRVRLDSELSDVAYRNHGYLRSYLYRGASISENGKSILRDYFSVRSYTSLSELREAVPILEIDDIYYAIANDLVSVDLASALVMHESSFCIYRDDQMREAVLESLRIDPSLPKAKRWTPDLFVQGSQVVISGQKHTIIVRGDHEIWLKPEQGSTFQLRNLEAEKAFKEGHLQVLTDQAEVDPLYFHSPLKMAGQKEFDHAIRMRDLFRKWQKGEARPPGDYTDRTYREYARREREVIARGQDSLIAFLPQWSKRGNRDARLIDRVSQIIEDTLEDHFDTLIGRTKWSVFGTLNTRLEAEGCRRRLNIDPPC